MVVFAKRHEDLLMFQEQLKKKSAIIPRVTAVGIWRSRGSDRELVLDGLLMP